MRTEEEIRAKINPKLHTTATLYSNYASFTRLIEEAEEFAKKNGVELKDVSIEAYGFDDYGDIGTDIILATERKKTAEEIDNEVISIMDKERESEEKRRDMFEELKKEFGD